MKKIIALLLVCIMSMSISAFAADFSDMPDDWSTTALLNAVENGLLSGSGGKILPSDNLTRAQMATIMVRACGATGDADISEFTDVTPNDWFYGSMSKAVAMGAFNGSGGMLNPESPISRQEAFVVLSRVFGLAINTKVDTSILNQFTDVADIAQWAANDVAAIVSLGYVGGNGGMLNPNANITRAEFAVVMDRLIKYYIDDENATTIPTDGNVMIRVGNLKLDGVETEKMVVIGDGVGDTELSFANSKIDSELVVRAGKRIALDGRYQHVKIIRPNVRVEGDIRRKEDSYEAEKVHKVYICKNSTFSTMANLGTPDQSTEKVEAEQ
ncbi:MAG: S-layer homology domain-containing protein [Clostridia bacterium]|nr:S-layer homology domain-containing protein [Oscillospiraceae bacterium]MBQ7960666.1 S-layer homology domain-containing protein [Clostridia bacterium]